MSERVISWRSMSTASPPPSEYSSDSEHGSTSSLPSPVSEPQGDRCAESEYSPSLCSSSLYSS